MGRFNEIQVGRFNRALQKLFSMPGEAVTPVLGTEITPSIHFPLGMEFRWLDGWDRYGIPQLVPATVGQVSAVRIRNPAASGVIGIIDKIDVAVGVAGEVDLSVVLAATLGVDHSTIVSSIPFDSRGRAASTLVNSNSSGVAPASIGNLMARAVLPAAQITQLILTESQEMPVLPGGFLDLRHTVANSSLTVTLWWRERFLEEYERQ